MGLGGGEEKRSSLGHGELCTEVKLHLLRGGLEGNPNVLHLYLTLVNTGTILLVGLKVRLPTYTVLINFYL